MKALTGWKGHVQHVPRHSQATAGSTSTIQRGSVRRSRLRVGCWTFFFLLLSSVLCPPSSVLAQVPQLINYQGRLLDGTNLVNGSVGLSLRLYDAASGGTLLYEDSNTVTVADGLYSTFIGDHPTNAAFLSALTNASVWIGVAVNGVALSPRERLASVGYSLNTRGLLVDSEKNIYVFNPQQNMVDPISDHSTIAGGSLNQVQFQAYHSTIAGGANNIIATNAADSFLGGGQGNSIHLGAVHSFLGGGYFNSIQASAGYSVLGGGSGNSIQIGANRSFLGGGSYNVIQIGSDLSVLGGGYVNVIQTNSFQSVLAGGRLNQVTGPWATVPGGRENAAASYSFAAGRRAKATNDGSFVWADSTDADFGTTSSNQFLIRASGGVGIGTTTPGAKLDVGGTFRVNGGTTFAKIQDGIFTAGPSPTNSLVRTNTFPVAFSTVPNITATAVNEANTDYGDAFAVTVRKVTTTNFVVNIFRVDANTLWGQNLRIAWHAWE